MLGLKKGGSENPQNTPRASSWLTIPKRTNPQNPQKHPQPTPVGKTPKTLKNSFRGPPRISQTVKNPLFWSKISLCMKKTPSTYIDKGVYILRRFSVPPLEKWYRVVFSCFLAFFGFFEFSGWSSWNGFLTPFWPFLVIFSQEDALGVFLSGFSTLFRPFFGHFPYWRRVGSARSQLFMPGFRHAHTLQLLKIYTHDVYRHDV